MRALSIVAAVLVLAGCGGNGDPLHAVRKAAQTTLGLTAQSTLTLTDSRLFGATPTIVGRGEFSFPKGLGYQALQLRAGTAYLVYLPKRLWIRPVSNAALPAGHLWVTTNFTSAPPRLALVAEAMNPHLLLEEIARGAVAASTAGHPVVAHVPFTEYVVSVDVERALRVTSQTDTLRMAMEQQLAELRAVGAGARVRVVARVDGAGRLAHLQGSFAGSKLGAVQIELWKFGSAIPLSLPLAHETMDIAPLHGAVSTARLFTG